MPEENVKVAVRVRPFNSREKSRNATSIVDMNGQNTTIRNPENPKEEPKKFTFDYSYWSHDGFKEEANGLLVPDSKHPNSKKFASQKTVFDDLGVGVLNNAWEGYNSTLFAYGQTGSGKSFSVVGYGENKGIVPQFCDQLFQQIDQKKAAGGMEFEVTFSMLEIYNEQVRDLLSSKAQKGGLKVRQHPKKGFYAEGLTSTPVGSYKEIDRKMDEGTRNRTVAATNMNATSSRAHTIVGITFSQKFRNAAGEDTTKTAIINLVDLAGSERAESTGATGDRLKEGAAINQSLSTLGNVISALAEKSGGNKKVRVPYRDSVLTKLLKNALAGNSKTIMVAAVSPADINYDESLSTLRYADRAKQIKTSASVNEDPTEKLIRELQEENDKLKKMLESGGVVVPKGTGEEEIEETEGMSEEEKAALKRELEEDYKAQLEENARQMEEMKQAFEEKLAAARQSDSNTEKEMDAIAAKKKTVPHIYNLNFDPMLTGNIVHLLEGKRSVGNQKGEPSDIMLMGPSIQEDHALFSVEGGKIYLDKTATNGRLLINGEPMTQKIELHHNDRLMFGTTQLYIFCNPKERDASKNKYPLITYEMAQEEIASKAGFDMNSQNKSRDDMLVQEDLVEILPAVEEVNSISEELDMKKKFEAVLVSPEARGELKGRTQVYVKMTDLETDLYWYWPREKFLNRKYIMQEMFEKFQEGEDWQIREDRNPFMENPEEDMCVGTVKLWLQSLSYYIEMKEFLEITDYKGTEVGKLTVEVVPCNKKGKEYTEDDDMWVESPTDLVGKEVHFNVKIVQANGLPSRFTDFFVRYSVYLDDQPTETNRIKDTINPEWKHKKQFSFVPATQQFVEYLQKDAIMILVYGKQKMPKDKKTVNTKDALQKESLAKGMMAAANTNTKVVDAQKVRFAMELAVAKKKVEKAETKVCQFKKLVEIAEQYAKPRISTKLIKDLLYAPTQKVADKCLAQVPKEKGAENGSEQKQSSTCVLL